MMVVGRLTVAVAVVAIGFGLGSAHANGVSLFDLIGGQSITAVDKTFSDWTLLDDTSLTSDDLDKIFIEALEDQPLNPGLRFLATDNVLTATDGGRVTLNFAYSVTAPGPRIKDNSLSLTGFEIGGEGSASIFADTYDTDGDILASTFVFADSVDVKTFDEASFFVQQVITVQSSIALDLLDAG